jgi:hypothetical protein
MEGVGFVSFILIKAVGRVFQDTPTAIKTPPAEAELTSIGTKTNTMLKKPDPTNFNTKIPFGISGRSDRHTKT